MAEAQEFAGEFVSFLPQVRTKADADREFFLREYGHLISPWRFAPEEIASREKAIRDGAWAECSKRIAQ